MDEVGRPRGLIDYATLEDCERRSGRRSRRRPVWKTLLRPRTMLYFSVWAAIGLAMLFALGTRSRIDISRRARPQPALHAADRRQRAQRLHRQAAQHGEPRRARMAIALDGPARRGDVDAARRAATTPRAVLEDTVPGRCDRSAAAVIVGARRRTARAATFAFDLVTLDDGRRKADTAQRDASKRPEEQTNEQRNLHRLAHDRDPGRASSAWSSRSTCSWRAMPSSTFGGVVVENSYVASQDFNGWLDEARAERALGWDADVGRDDAAARDRWPCAGAPDRR